MEFFWKHKLFSLFLAFLVYYFLANHSHRFGFALGGVVVYNRVPVSLMDFYVDTSGAMLIEQNFADLDVYRSWYKAHLQGTKMSESVRMFVGTGFSGNQSFKLPQDQIDSLKYMGFDVKIMGSREAIKQYNAAKDSGIASAILLHTR